MPQKAMTGIWSRMGFREGYGMMYYAGEKTGKTECDVRIEESVAAVEERAAGLAAKPSMMYHLLKI